MEGVECEMLKESDSVRISRQSMQSRTSVDWCVAARMVEVAQCFFLVFLRETSLGDAAVSVSLEQGVLRGPFDVVSHIFSCERTDTRSCSTYATKNTGLRTYPFLPPHQSKAQHSTAQQGLRSSPQCL